MRKGIHPENYRIVAFKDMSNEDVFLTRSTVNTKETLEVDGVEYPLVKLEISRTSHPFYTGKSNVSDTLPTGQLSNIPWRRAGVKYTNNEAYFDVIEVVLHLV